MNMNLKVLKQWPMSCVFAAFSCVQAEVQDTQAAHARAVVCKAERNDLRFEGGKDLGDPEAFRVIKKGDSLVVEHQTSAGALYGAQAVIQDDYEPGVIEVPDFRIRGTTLYLMKGQGYDSTMNESKFPWFYDKAFMTRTLETFAENRMNTIFLWAGHLFPYIVEMPKYPEAAAASPEQIKINQAQFKWFAQECEKRNIQILLHFYNIHVDRRFAKEHGIRHAPNTPTPLLREYTYYALSRYFEAFPSVGLYTCPGESIKSEYQLEWFRDVVFKAAKDSGKNPLIVIRDWTLNMDFKEQMKDLYGNVYSECKQNDESLTSPHPDMRHMRWEGKAHGHVINAMHGPAEDLQPMRWASPVMVQEMARYWKALGFVTGVEYWGMSNWRWPYTGDKLADGERLLSLDRDHAYYAVAGRYMWSPERDSKDEEAFWKRYFSKKYNSKEIGERMWQWFTVTGSISPGIQNLNATKVANFWSTMTLMNQDLDKILNYNPSLKGTPPTLYREAGRAAQRTSIRPMDEYLFNRYKAEYNEPKTGLTVEMYEEFWPYKERMGIQDIEQRHSMPVTQYAQFLEAGKTDAPTMTPDKVVLLLNQLAKESLVIAQEMEAACTDEALKPELQRYVTDSEMYVFATQAMIHRENAAILKARMLIRNRPDLADEFIKEMEASVAVYEKLVELTTGTYLYCHELYGRHWSNEGIGAFKGDLAKQTQWIANFIATGDSGAVKPASKKAVTLKLGEMTKQKDEMNGAVSVQAEELVGRWKAGTKYRGFEGAGYVAAPARSSEPISGRIKLSQDSKYTVSVRALKGGAHQDRALVVEINGKRLKTTHEGHGPAAGAYSWEEAGIIKLPVGVVDIKVYPVGKAHPTVDSIMISPVAEK